MFPNGHVFQLFKYINSSLRVQSSPGGDTLSSGPRQVYFLNVVKTQAGPSLFSEDLSGPLWK